MALETMQAMLADALVASGPDPEHVQALMLFGQFVGEWEFDWVAYDAEGRQLVTESGEWIFGWVLEGRAVQDVWIIPPRGRRESDGEYGTTIRFYDPANDAWLVTWNGPIGGSRRTFLARPSNEGIVQHGETEDGFPMRWIFSEIAEASFRWRSVVTKDGGDTWQLREEMHVRRKPT
jgi:hypothetical protein